MAGLAADFYFDFEKVMPSIYWAITAARAADLAAISAQGREANQVAKAMTEWEEASSIPYNMHGSLLLKGMPLNAWETIEKARDVAEESWHEILNACEPLGEDIYEVCQQKIRIACQPLREMTRLAWESSAEAWRLVQNAEALVWWPLRIIEGVVWGSEESDSQWQAISAATTVAYNAWIAADHAACDLFVRYWDESTSVIQPPVAPPNPT